MKWVDPTCRLCEIDHSITDGAKVKYKIAIKVTATGLFLLFGTLANAEKIGYNTGLFVEHPFIPDKKIPINRK